MSLDMFLDLLLYQYQFVFMILTLNNFIKCAHDFKLIHEKHYYI